MARAKTASLFMIKKSSPLVSLFIIIVGLLSLSINEINANPRQTPHTQVQTQSEGNLGAVMNAVLEDAAQRSGLSSSAFDKITVERTTWSDGCLGVQTPGEFCTQALVPGWRITLSHDGKTWVYHTSTEGRIRFASQK